MALYMCQNYRALLKIVVSRPLENWASKYNDRRLGIKKNERSQAPGIKDGLSRALKKKNIQTDHHV